MWELDAGAGMSYVQHASTSNASIKQQPGQVVGTGFGGAMAAQSYFPQENSLSYQSGEIDKTLYQQTNLHDEYQAAYDTDTNMSSAQKQPVYNLDTMAAKQSIMYPQASYTDTMATAQASSQQSSSNGYMDTMITAHMMNQSPYGTITMTMTHPQTSFAQFNALPDQNQVQKLLVSDDETAPIIPSAGVLPGEIGALPLLTGEDLDMLNFITS
jgi:hypothetical protein